MAFNIHLSVCEEGNIEEIVRDLDVDVLDTGIVAVPTGLSNTTFKQLELPLGSETIMKFDMPSDLTTSVYFVYREPDTENFVFVDTPTGDPRLIRPDESLTDDLANKNVEKVIFLVPEGANITEVKQQLEAGLEIIICGKCVFLTRPMFLRCYYICYHLSSILLVP